MKFVVRGSKNASEGSFYDFLRFHGAETMNKATDGYHCAKVALCIVGMNSRSAGGKLFNARNLARERQMILMRNAAAPELVGC